ncbi:hypothetical protein PN499_10145 [Kamptonema animale CS-326]|jgi:hypothetical protein|uniref:hypothetical protein n=1 Tax=Kamptonema animale TaxID=92934 RepID=UPI00232CE2C3|nr:hypothetical protein [Kamptonema animale]MDB9511541.1 hypothetical protein [Kamptonema animale CS-326]
MTENQASSVFSVLNSTNYQGFLLIEAVDYGVGDTMKTLNLEALILLLFLLWSVFWMLQLFRKILDLILHPQPFLIVRGRDGSADFGVGDVGDLGWGDSGWGDSGWGDGGGCDGGGD